jgi:hypothetical protein
MRRPQVTLRTLLVLILVIGVVLGFGMPALEILRTKESHEHTSLGDSRGRWGMVIESVDAPFWPRYWRRLLGEPWKEQPLCRATPGRIEEVCSFARPEIVVKKGDLYSYTPVQFALYRRLKTSPTPPPPPPE